MARSAAKSPKHVDPKTGMPDRGKAAPAGRTGREAGGLSFAQAAGRSLEGNKCQDVLVLDLRGRSQVTDFFVIASGTSDRQMHSAAEHVVEMAEGLGESLFRSNLDEAKTTWLVLDFVDVVVHVFMPEARLYYDLEMLWGDAPRVEFKRDCLEDGPAAKRNRAGLTAEDVLPGRKKK
jgi:ribosome-associated protein